MADYRVPVKEMGFVINELARVEVVCRPIIGYEREMEFSKRIGVEAVGERRTIEFT